MALTTQQRRLLLGAALAVTVAATVWLQGTDESNSDVVSTAQPESSAERKSARTEPEERLTLDKLKRAPVEDKPEDMFTAKSWYVAPPPAKKGPPPKPEAPPLPFTYMGRMVDGATTTVFLTKANRSYALKLGDTIDGTYRVEAIEPNGVTLTYLPLNLKQVLATGGIN